MLITSAIYMTTIEGFRPTWQTFTRVIIYLNLYMIAVFGLNQLIGSNYLFVARKPPGPALLDAPPEWPVYILYMEGIGLVMFLLLYLPFAFKDWRAERKQPAT